MARDLKVFQDPITKNWDLRIENGDFVTTEGLDTALFMSVLCEARADTSQATNAVLRRGHFSNIFLQKKGDQLGSLVWYYSQKPNTEANRSLVKQSIEKSLEWLTKKSIAKKVIVEVVRTTEGFSVKIKIISVEKEVSRYYDLFIKTK